MSLHELVKTYKFSNVGCLQKGLRDQIIEGLQHGEIIQELLQLKYLIVQVIFKCRGLEAAKQSRRSIWEKVDVSAVQKQLFEKNKQKFMLK